MYDEPYEPAIIARAYIPPPHLSSNHLADQFLFLSQNRDDNTNLGWGLRVERIESLESDEPVHCPILDIDRGFINSQWPTRLRYAGTKDEEQNSTDTLYVEKLTSYMEPGRLVQAMVIAPYATPLAVKWKLGGKIQLVTGPNQETSYIDNTGLWNYSTKTSSMGEVLTVTGNKIKSPVGPYPTICLDIALFVNGKAQQLKLQDGAVNDNFVDISCSEVLAIPANFEATSLVAVISLRNAIRNQNPLPSRLRCPLVRKLREDLMVDDKPLDQLPKSLSELLKERAPTLHLRHIPSMVASGVQRALSCLVPFELENPGAVSMIPIRNALHGHAVIDVDVQECL